MTFHTAGSAMDGCSSPFAKRVRVGDRTPLHEDHRWKEKRTTLACEGPRNKSQPGTRDDVSGERPMIDADHRRGATAGRTANGSP